MQPDVSPAKSKSYYRTSYLGNHFQRLCSYQQQLLYATRSSPERVLIVGQGDGFVAGTLRQMGIEVFVVDIDPDLAPDLVASVDNMGLADNSFDVCICCEVLEHLPFERFAGCLNEILRVTRDRLVLSLPDIRRFFCIRLRCARINLERQVSLPRLRTSTVPRSRIEQYGHHWEIGYKGYGVGRIRQVISEAEWRLLECRRIPDLPWHTFFYLATGA